nr:MAG TPA: hypothetical protein [Caudoviricetes sp.]
MLFNLKELFLNSFCLILYISMHYNNILVVYKLLHNCKFKRK